MGLSPRVQTFTWAARVMADDRRVSAPLALQYLPWLLAQSPESALQVLTVSSPALLTPSASRSRQLLLPSGLYGMYSFLPSDLPLVIIQLPVVYYSAPDPSSLIPSIHVNPHLALRPDPSSLIRIIQLCPYLALRGRRETSGTFTSSFMAYFSAHSRPCCAPH